MKNYFTFLFTLSLLLGVALGHSWLACADYSEENGSFYDNAKCHGFPRSYSNYYDPTFGGDRGFDNIPTDTTPCNDARNGAALSTFYTSQYPMATYKAGSRYCMAWPAKNHVAATCTNVYIPDGGIQILRSPVNPTADPTQTQFKASLVDTINGHVENTIDFKGFQNCPQFCSNGATSMGLSLCTGCFTVPANLTPGLYTFQWYWEFNAGQFYSSCFDVNIVDANTPTSGGVPTSSSGSGVTQTATSSGTVSSSGTPASSGNGIPCGDPSYCTTVCADAGVAKCTCENGNWSVGCFEVASSSSIFAPSFFLVLAALAMKLFC